MNKQRKPVIFEIEGTSFEVDIDKQVLRQTNDQTNEISFVTDMTDQLKNYTFTYDLRRKNVYDKSTGFYESEDWHQIKVPKLIELDPEGMAKKYGYTVEQLKGKTDFEIIIDQETLAQRQNGILPQIDLAGEKFTIDLRLHELRNSQYFFPVISLKNFELTNDGWHYEAYYHPVMKQVVEVDPKLLEFPEGVVKLKIPNEIGLDPVATARQYGMDERELLRRYPIQKDLTAEVIPLSETHIPALIRHNREALQQEHRNNAQRLRPKHRPKF
ncbi:hypothetical protein ACVW0P_002609 [Mucilaginibacter sp. UYNi724]